MKSILLSMRVTESKSYYEKRNSIAYEYIEFFEKLGYLVILIPNNTSNLKKYFNDDVCLTVLSGGNNVDPYIYGSDIEIDDVYKERDKTEQELVKISLLYRIPILGICRGAQFLNALYGGSLVNDLKNHVSISHKLNSTIDYLDCEISNSYHNQSISAESISPAFQALASSDDNNIEMFINRQKLILGLQWHPERQYKDYDKKLINEFLMGYL